MNNNLDELELLKLTKAELSKPAYEQHKYSAWQKEENENIKYTRTCTKCGHIEEIVTSTIDLDIENVIKKQEKGIQLTDYFCNSTKEELTNKNILFFLANTTDYQSYLDINRITSKLVSINKDYQTHNDYEENLIYNAVVSLQRVGEIPEQLFNLINEYISPSEKENNVSRRAA